MKNTVTFKTAVALKDAGFPQSVPAAGQFWYNFEGNLFCVQRIENSLGFLFQVGGNSFVFNCIFDEMIVAPQATDILKELGSHSWSIRHYTPEGVFSCAEKDSAHGNLFMNASLHEVAAQAYLKRIK